MYNSCNSIILIYQQNKQNKHGFKYYISIKEINKIQDSLHQNTVTFDWMHDY